VLAGKDIDTRAVTETVLTDELWQRLEGRVHQPV
jgi:hypothetical protein